MLVEGGEGGFEFCLAGEESFVGETGFFAGVDEFAVGDGEGLVLGLGEGFEVGGEAFELLLQGDDLGLGGAFLWTITGLWRVGRRGGSLPLYSYSYSYLYLG